MLLLAVDTCDARGSVALLRDAQLLHGEVHSTPEDYSSWLLPAVSRVLESEKITLADLQACAVATGPGSFTGVRVGLTTVKAWNEVHSLPIAPVSRLEALSSYSCTKAPFIAVCVDAHRRQVFGAVYRRTQSGLEAVGDELVTDPDVFLSGAIQASGSARIEWISPDPRCLVGTEQWEARASRGENIYVVAPILAPAIGRIGHRMAREGRLTDALSLDANYVRRPDAEILWKGSRGHAH
jgi:tRNA threonylcarbamoyladenosine biosynthesis protein TsaB